MKNKTINGLLMIAVFTSIIIGSTSCSNREQEELYPVSIIGKITVIDADGFELKTSDVLPIIIGIPHQLSYSFSPVDATVPKLSFKVDDTNIAKVTEDGLITGVTDGITTLTIAPRVGFGISASTVVLTLNVVTNPVLVTGIDVVGLPEKIFIGETATFSATIAPINATYKRLIYKALTPEIATIDEKGVITGVAKGTASFRITSTDSGAFEKDFTLEIDQIIPVQSADINNKPVYDDSTEYSEWAVGETYALTYTTVPIDASAYTLQWSSSDTSIASVSSDGVVKFLKPGKVIITLTSPATGYTDSVEFTVAEGFIRELFNTSNYTWIVEPSYINNGASIKWNSEGNYVRCKFTYPQGRADIKFYPSGNSSSPDSENKVMLHAGNYPIIAFKMTDPRITDGLKKCVIGLTSNKGDWGNGKGNYATYKASDGIPIYYFDLTKKGFGKEPFWIPTTSAVEIQALKLIVADIPTTEGQDYYYNMYWVKAFKSEADLKAYADTHLDEF